MTPPGPRLPTAEPRSRGRRLLRVGRDRLAAVRRVRPTAEGGVFLATALAVSLAALNTGNNLLYLVFAAMLSLVALSGVLSEAAVSQVRVSRRMADRAFAGEPSAGTWILENPRTRLPHLALRVDEVGGPDADLQDASGTEAAYLPPRSVARQPGTWTFSRRGLHRLHAVRVSTRWPFGIFHKWYDLAAPLEVLVLPRPADSPPPARRRSDRGPLAAPSRGGGRGDLLDLRLWREGEDPSLIHWRTSARRDRRVVVDRERDEGGSVLIEVSAPSGPRREGAFEEGLSVATAQILGALGEDLAIRLRLPGQPELVASSPDEVGPLLRALALAQLPLASP